MVSMPNVKGAHTRATYLVLYVDESGTLICVQVQQIILIIKQFFKLMYGGNASKRAAYASAQPRIFQNFSKFFFET